MFHSNVVCLPTLLVTKQLAVNTGPGDLPGNLAAGGALHRPALGCCGVSPGQLATNQFVSFFLFALLSHVS